MQDQALISFHVPPAFKAALQQMAKAQDRSLSSLLRQILKNWLINHYKNKKEVHKE